MFKHQINFSAQIHKTYIKALLKAIGGSNTFFTKFNFGFYMKALSTNYKPVCIELKNIIQFLRYCTFYKKFPVQMYGPQVFWGQFS